MIQIRINAFPMAARAAINLMFQAESRDSAHQLAMNRWVDGKLTDSELETVCAGYDRITGHQPG